MSVVRPGQENRAFDVLKRKFFCSGGRTGLGQGYEDWGLTIFPATQSEAPVKLTEGQLAAHGMPRLRSLLRESTPAKKHDGFGFLEAEGSVFRRPPLAAKIVATRVATYAHQPTQYTDSEGENRVQLRKFRPKIVATGPAKPALDHARDRRFVPL